MERKSLVLTILLILGLAACSQPPTSPETEAVSLPPEPTPTEPTQETENPTAESLAEPVALAPTQEDDNPAAEQPTATPLPTGLITGFMLANMTYSSEFAAEGGAPLSNGKYSEPAAPGSATETVVTLLPNVAYGELNGQPVAASVLATDPGGSGTFYSLHIVGLDENEAPVDLASVFLGDRVEIESINIAYDQVTVELIAAGPEDPLCCPTQQVVQIYELWGKDLVQTASDVVGEVVEPLPSDLYYRLWTWQRSLDKKNQTVMAIEEPEKYSLIFYEDGTFQYTAGCNRGSGAYAADNQGAIRFHPSDESLLDCGPNSHFEAMRATLDKARLYRSGRNTLSLVWGDESTVDIYRDSGPVAPEEDNLAITPEQIDLSLKGLFETWTAVEVPARPVEPGSPPGSGSLPRHIEIYFENEDPAQRNGGAILYIIPVADYVALWELAGDTTASARVDAVYDFARLVQDPLPSGGVPILPGEEARGMNDLAVQIAQTGAGLSSASQTGYRFVGRVTEESGPVINQYLRYIYQGFTNGGKYLVAFFSPVHTAELPDFSADLPPEKIDLFNNDLNQYLAAEAGALNELPPDAWEPDLSSLDALVNSLQIEGIAPAGVKNTSWTWTGHMTNPKTGDVIRHDLQGDYTVDYGDFTFRFTADCYEDSRSYDILSGGMIGAIAVQAAENDPVECGEGSFAGQFIEVLQEANEYRVLPGGAEMILAMPGGEADYLLRDRNTPLSEKEPGAEEMADEAGSEAAAETTVEEGQEDSAAGAEAETEAASQEPGTSRTLADGSFSMKLGGEAESYEWQVVPAMPIAGGPGGRGFPSHILITFDGEDPQEVLRNNGRHMYIFPFEQYQELYQAAGRGVIGEQAARLRELIDSENNRSVIPQGAMPLLPPAAGAVNRWAQYRAQDFGSGSGVRYLADSPHRQAIGVWSNASTAYSFQGLSDDGRYYISLWWPVSTPALPETADLAAQAIKARAVDPLTNPAYIQETADMLNALNPADFSPRLSLLDAMVASLTFGE